MSFQKLIDLVKKLSNNYTTIISREILYEYKELNWGNNGIGDRWANKKFNYTLIYYTKKIKTYSENINDTIDEITLNNFIKTYKSSNKGIIGIFVHSLKLNKIIHPISKNILLKIKSQNCVSCGSSNDIICDHKNDFYNNKRVLKIQTQKLSDFQPLCNHCNLLKRQINKNEKNINKLFSAKEMQKISNLSF